jgi:hypothetical protein
MTDDNDGNNFNYFEFMFKSEFDKANSLLDAMNEHFFKKFALEVGNSLKDFEKYTKHLENKPVKLFKMPIEYSREANFLFKAIDNPVREAEAKAVQYLFDTQDRLPGRKKAKNNAKAEILEEQINDQNDRERWRKLKQRVEAEDLKKQTVTRLGETPKTKAKAQELEDMFNYKNKSGGGKIIAEGQAKELEKIFGEKSKKSIGEMAKGIAGLAAGFTDFLLPLFLLQQGFQILIGGIDDFINKTVESSNSIVLMAQRTSISTEKLQDLAKVMQMQDFSLSFDKAAGSIENLQEELTKMRFGMGDQTPFKMLGLDVMGKDATQVIDDLSERIKGLDDRAAIVMLKMAHLQPAMLSYMRLSKEEKQKQLEETNIFNLNDSQFKEVNKMGQKQLLLNMHFKNAGDQLVAHLAPILTRLIIFLDKLIIVLTPAILYVVDVLTDLISLIRLQSRIMFKNVGNAIFGKRFTDMAIGWLDGNSPNKTISGIKPLPVTNPLLNDAMKLPIVQSQTYLLNQNGKLYDPNKDNSKQVNIHNTVNVHTHNDNLHENIKEHVISMLNEANQQLQSQFA